eukprot:COSAG04_NODE_11383_length_712_cov_1.114192_1_plen_62_part_10
MSHGCCVHSATLHTKHDNDQPIRQSTNQTICSASDDCWMWPYLPRSSTRPARLLTLVRRSDQ